MTSICIIGAGATGILLLLLLQEAGVDVTNISIVDPYFDVGDLARKWTSVISNTPWSKTIDSLRAACPSLAIPVRADADSTTPLVEIAHLLRSLVSPVLQRVKQIQGHVLQSNYDTSKQLWMTVVNVGGTQQTIETSKLILTQGSEPKTMNLPIPSIPLEIALDISRVKQYVKRGEKILVFGTMHSGTLVIQNLVSLGAEVIGYYQSEKPFYWARDGAYDGIKADAADIADKIVAGNLPVTLVPTKDTAQVIRTSHSAQWTVFAMGFTPRLVEMRVDGTQCSSSEYDEHSGRILGAPAWGFGIAYPNRAPDGIHWDVSVASFLEHMKQQLPKIIE